MSDVADSMGTLQGVDSYDRQREAAWEIVAYYEAEKDDERQRRRDDWLAVLGEVSAVVILSIQGPARTLGMELFWYIAAGAVAFYLCTKVAKSYRRRRAWHRLVCAAIHARGILDADPIACRARPGASARRRPL